MALDDQVAAVDHELGPLLCARCDQTDDAIAGGGGDDRAHFAGRIAARANADGSGLLGDDINQLVGGGADGDRGGDGHAALAGRAEPGRNQVIGGEVEICVGEDDGVVLGAAKGLDALAVGVGALVDIAGDRS